MPLSSSDSSSSDEEDHLLSYRPFSPSKNSGKENRCSNERGRNKNVSDDCESSSDNEPDVDELLEARSRADKCDVPSLVASPSQLAWYRQKCNKQDLYYPCCLCLRSNGTDDENTSHNNRGGDKSLIRLIWYPSFEERKEVPRDSLVPYHGGADHIVDKGRWSKEILGLYRKQRMDDSKRAGKRQDESNLVEEAFYLERVLRVALERSSKTASTDRSKPMSRIQEDSVSGSSTISESRRENQSKNAYVERRKNQSSIEKDERSDDSGDESITASEVRRTLKSKAVSALRRKPQSRIQQEGSSEYSGDESNVTLEGPTKPNQRISPGDDDDEEEEEFEMATCDMEVPYTQDLRLDSDDEAMAGFRLESSSNEPIRPGDVIEYYSQMFVTGDKRGLRTATVLSIDPGRDPILVLDNGEFLPADTQIRRIKTVFEGNLQDHPGIYRSIETFKLTKNIPEGAGVEAGIQKESERLGKVIRKNVVRFKEKVEATGFAPLDVLNKYKCVDEAPMATTQHETTARKIPQTKNYRVSIDTSASSHRRKVDSDSSSHASDDDSLGWSAAAKSNERESDQDNESSGAGGVGRKGSLSGSSSSEDESDKDLSAAKTTSCRGAASSACTTPSNTFGSMQLSSQSSADDDMDITPQLPGRGRNREQLSESSRKHSPKRKSPASPTAIATTRRKTKSDLSDFSASSDDNRSLRQKQRKITEPCVKKTPVGRTKHKKKKTPAVTRGRTPPSATSTLSFDSSDDEDFERPMRSPLRSPIPVLVKPTSSGGSPTPRRRKSKASKGGGIASQKKVREGKSKKRKSKSPKPRGGKKLEKPQLQLFAITRRK